MLKARKYILPTFQNKTQSMKNKFLFNNSKQGKMALYYSKKTITIVKKSNVKTKNKFESQKM